MYFMHLCQGTGDKLASKEQSSWICFTAVKLSTLWMSCRRGNNKRNSWSNYQPDKNALNFKKGSDKRHLQLSQTRGVRDCGSQQRSSSAASAVRTWPHVWLKQEISKLCLCCRHHPWGTPLLLGLFWEEEKGKEPGKKNKDSKSTDIIYPSQEIPMPLQQNAVHIGFISTTKRIVRCFSRNNS